MINYVSLCRFQAHLYEKTEYFRAMTQTDTRKVLLGAALLVAGTVVLVSGQFTTALPGVLGSLAALGLAAGALLVGTSHGGRPV